MTDDSKMPWPWLALAANDRASGYTILGCTPHQDTARMLAEAAAARGTRTMVVRVHDVCEGRAKVAPISLRPVNGSTPGNADSVNQGGAA